MSLKEKRNSISKSLLMRIKENVLLSLYISFIGLGIGFRVREEVMEVFRKFYVLLGGKSSRSLSMWIKRNIVIYIFFIFW